MAFDFFHDFEGSVLFTINAEDFFFVAHVIFLIEIHAVIGTFCTFNVEVDLAVRFAAFYTSAYIAALFTANDASMSKLGKVQLVHLHWGLRSNNWSLHPHRAAVMHPMIESISHRSIWCLQQHLIPAYEPAVIFRSVVILFLMLVKIQLVVCNVFLSLDRFAHLSKFWNRRTFFFALFDFQQLLIEFLEQLLFVALLSKEQLVQTCVVLISSGCLLLIDLVLLQSWLRLSNIINLLNTCLIIELFNRILSCFGRYFLDLVFIKVLISAEDIGGLHRASSLWAEEALDHQASAESEDLAVVAFPVNFRHPLYSIAGLVHRNGARSTKDDLIIFFIVAILAYGTAGILLCYLCPLLGAQLVAEQLQPPFQFFLPGLERIFISINLHFLSFSLQHLIHFIHFAKYFAILLIISMLLRELKLLQEIRLELGWVVDVQQILIQIL